MNKPLNLQDVLLNELRRENTPVIIFLTNGFQIKGAIKGFDSFVLLIVEPDGKQNMIYKHAISTIVPSKPCKINLDKGDNND